jgi:hypothetical protein
MPLALKIGFRSSILQRKTSAFLLVSRGTFVGRIIALGVKTIAVLKASFRRIRS